MYTLLVLDDENIVRRGIRSLVDFEALGIGQHFEAENGEEALALMETHTIDLVLADINMPKMDGLEFARRAKAKNPALRIALMTGYDYLEYAVHAIKIGVDDYLLKPISKVDVEQVIRRLTDKMQEDERSAQLRSAMERLAPKAEGQGDGLKKQLEGLLWQHMASPSFTLGQMAGLTGYSTSYLSTQFKRLFGESFRDYFLKLRLERAKILLLSTDMKNYEVAAAVGFEDPNYFSVCFKRQYHITTTEFKAGATHEKEV